MLADTVQAIRAGRPPQTDGREGRRSLALVLAMYASAERRQEVEVKHV